MKHLDEGTLRALLDGETVAEDVDSVREHLDGCEHCRTLLEELRNASSVVGAALARLDTAVRARRREGGGPRSGDCWGTDHHAHHRHGPIRLRPGRRPRPLLRGCHRDCLACLTCPWMDRRRVGPCRRHVYRIDPRPKVPWRRRQPPRRRRPPSPPEYVSRSRRGVGRPARGRRAGDRTRRALRRRISGRGVRRSAGPFSYGGRVDRGHGRRRTGARGHTQIRRCGIDPRERTYVHYEGRGRARRCRPDRHAHSRRDPHEGPIIPGRGSGRDAHRCHST